MTIPIWLTLGVAVLVILFGVHRIRLSLRPDEPAGEGDAEPSLRPRRGLYGMSRRAHRFIGVMYLLLGGALIATSFGWNPLGDLFGPSTEAPPKDQAPASKTIPIDKLPPPPAKQ